MTALPGSEDDLRHMRHALALGRRGLGQTWPNPSVGCVIVASGQVVGRGITQPGGRPHAETQALAQAGARARGATAYVTLEPCAHQGQTPPCTQALIAAGIARVVSPISDKDPRVAGQGFAQLRAAGVQVDLGCCAAEAARDHAGFFARLSTGRPCVTLKLALSLDGRIATASGESQWITGPQARHVVHGLRHSHDAVMVGGGTARDDDPALTVRGFGDVRQPVRVVLSRYLDLPSDGTLACTARDTPVWLCHAQGVAQNRVDAWHATGATLIPCAVSGQHLDPTHVLTELGTRGLTRVFCEGGGALAASLLSADLVDDVIVFSAGLAIGAEGRPGLSALGLNRLHEATRFELKETRPCGADVLHHWRRSRTK